MISSRSPLIWGEEYDPVIAKQDFIKMPYPLIMRLAEVVQDPAVAVLSELIWQSFTTGKSCFRYSSARLDRYVNDAGWQFWNGRSGSRWSRNEERLR